MTKPVDREALEAVLIEALDKTLDTERSSEDYGVRCFFGVGELGETSQGDFRRVMDALMDAAIAELARKMDWCNDELVFRNYLGERLKALLAGKYSAKGQLEIYIRRPAGRYSHAKYTCKASIDNTDVRAKHLDTAITECRRRADYDGASTSMVLIEPPVEQVAGDGRVITDRDTEIATGDFSDQSGDVEPADDSAPL